MNSRRTEFSVFPTILHDGGLIANNTHTEGRPTVAIAQR